MDRTEKRAVKDIGRALQLIANMLEGLDDARTEGVIDAVLSRKEIDDLVRIGQRLVDFTQQDKKAERAQEEQGG